MAYREGEEVHIDLQTERPAISTATPPKSQTPEMTIRHVFSFSFYWGLLVLLTGTPFLRMLSLHPACRPWSGLVPSSTPKHTANHPPPHHHHHLFHHSFVFFQPPDFAHISFSSVCFLSSTCPKKLSYSVDWCFEPGQSTTYRAKQ